MTRNAIVYVLLVASCTATTSALGTPAEDFVSDELLSQAVAEIKGMHAEQLDSLIEYISACSASVGGEQKELLCEVSKTRFQIRNVSARAMYRLVVALELHEHMVTRQWDGATSEERTSMAKYIKRSVDIYTQLKNGAAQRYAELPH